MAVPGLAWRPESTVWDQGWSGGVARLVLHSGLAIAAGRLGDPYRSRVDERTVRGFHHRKSDHASDRNDRRSPRWHLVGWRLYFYASDLFARPFPGRRSCQLPVWPTRCTPGPIRLFFARSHHAYRRYRWSHGSSTSMADRPRSIGGDFGRNYELASGNKRALAPLRAGRVSRSRACCTENGKPTRIGARASLHRPGNCSQRDRRDSLYFLPAVIRFKKFTTGGSEREHVF